MATEAAATSISGSTPAGAVSAAINSTSPIQGTAASVDGATLVAGHNVNIQGKDNLDTVADTTNTYTYNLSGTPLTLSFDVSLFNTAGGAGLRQPGSKRLRRQQRQHPGGVR